jgi:hypothetical protein
MCYKIPFATRIADPINSQIPDKKARSQEHHVRSRKKQTACPHIAEAILGCINFLYELYHLYMMKQRLTKKHKKKRIFQTLPHNAPAMKKKDPFPPRKTTHGLVPKFAARCQLFHTYSPTPTNNNCMKQKPSNNSI